MNYANQRMEHNVNDNNFPALTSENIIVENTLNAILRGLASCDVISIDDETILGPMTYDANDDREYYRVRVSWGTHHDDAGIFYINANGEV